MFILSLVFFLVFLTHSTCCATFTLSSPRLSVTFDTTSGNIVSFKDVLSNTELIESNTRYFIFKVDDVWKSHEAVTPDSIITTSTKVTTYFTISSLPVRTTFEVEGDDISCSILIDNEGSGKIVDEYHFPEFRFKRNLSTFGNERMFLGRVDGLVLQGLGLEDMWACGTYPGSFSMQLFSFYNDEMGIGFEFQDPFLWTKNIGFETSGKSYVNLCSQILMPYEPSLVIPEIKIVMFPTKKHWLNTTRHYVVWAEQQKWFQDALVRNSPSWINEDQIVLIEAGLQPERAGPQIMPAVKQGEICTKWSEALNDGTGGKVDIKMMPIMRGWERYGEYINPFYRPLTIGWVNNFSEPILAEAVNKTRNAGHHSLAMVSGVKWHKSRSQKLYQNAYWVRGFYENIEYPPFENNLVSSWNQARPTAEEVCTLEKDQSGCTMQSDSDWAGLRTEMCLGHNYDNFEKNFARETLVDLAETFADMGLDNFEIDQMNGVMVQPCFNGSHGHPKGYGNWSSKRAQDLYKSIRDAGRAKNPNFIVSIEDPIEFVLPYLDLVGCRPPYYNKHPAPQSLKDVKDGEGNVQRWGYTVPGFVSVYGKVSRCFTLDLRIKTAWPMDWSKDKNIRIGMESLARTFIQGSWLTLYLDTYELVNWKIPSPEGWVAANGSYSTDYDSILQLPEYAHPIHFEYLQNLVRSQFIVLDEYHKKPDLVIVEVSQEPSMYVWIKQIWDNVQSKEIEEKQKDYTLFYQGWRLRSNPNQVAVAITGYDYTSSHTIGKPSKLDGVVISQDRCVNVTRNGCYRKRTKYSEISSVITVQPLENIVFEFLEDSGNCEVWNEEKNICEEEPKGEKIFHNSSSHNRICVFLLYFVLFVFVFID